MKRYSETLNDILKDPKEAANYLNSILEDGDEKLFLLALRQVAQAQGGMSALSRRTKLNRANLYAALSKRGRPEWPTINHILNAVGLRLAVMQKPTRA